MTTSFQEEQKDRRETLEHDKRLRDQQRGATYSTFAEAFADEERGGRFKAVNQTAMAAMSRRGSTNAAMSTRRPMLTTAMSLHSRGQFHTASATAHPSCDTVPARPLAHIDAATAQPATIADAIYRAKGFGRRCRRSR
jgi:hypothetical protein